MWASCYGNEVTRYDAKTKMARSVSPWLHTLDSEPNKAKYRCHWTPPLAIDPFDHNTVYYGCQMILRTTNGGVSWTELSRDLSHKDPSRIVSSGGIVGDNLGQFYGEVVFAIAPSEIQKGLIWAGTNDGKVWYTRDAGKNWMDVTANIKGMPDWGVISKIEPSHFDPGTAYICVDFHLMDNRDPWIYKTTDFGKTWRKISDGLPKGPLAYARVVAENPNRKGMLFAGTGNALYYTMNDGEALEAPAGRPAARSRLLDRGAEAIPRPGALHLRPRLLHHGRHHAARAGRDGGGRRRPRPRSWWRRVRRTAWCRAGARS